MRMLRLALGLMVIWQGVDTGEWFAVIAGAIFAGLAIANKGCMGGTCYAPPVRRRSSQFQSTEEVTYEEVVDKK